MSTISGKPENKNRKKKQFKPFELLFFGVFCVVGLQRLLLKENLGQKQQQRKHSMVYQCFLLLKIFSLPCLFFCARSHWLGWLVPTGSRDTSFTTMPHPVWSPSKRRQPSVCCSSASKVWCSKEGCGWAFLIETLPNWLAIRPPLVGGGVGLQPPQIFAKPPASYLGEDLTRLRVWGLVWGD